MLPKPVARATRRALVVGDMPFLSYHLSTEQAVANDPLIHTLMQQFDARVLPGSIRAGARAALSA